MQPGVPHLNALLSNRKCPYLPLSDRHLLPDGLVGTALSLAGGCDADLVAGFFWTFNLKPISSSYHTKVLPCDGDQRHNA